jgi:hypothetical protein
VSGYAFTVFTPGRSVRLASDRSPDDFVEISLDTSGSVPLVMGHARRTRGNQVIETERAVGDGDVSTITEEQILAFVLAEVEQLLQR